MTLDGLPIHVSNEVTWMSRLGGIAQQINLLQEKDSMKSRTSARIYFKRVDTVAFFVEVVHEKHVVLFYAVAIRMNMNE